MTRATRMTVTGLAVCALVFVASSVSVAGTIIKLDLGNVGPDVGMNGAGILSTVDDGNAATTGDQNTSVVYTGFLSPIPNITPATASFSLAGLTAVPPATLASPLVIQNFTGGTFSLYDSANVLLLQGTLDQSALTGVIGPPGTGALFTTTLGNVTLGTLVPFIEQGTVSLSMNLTNVSSNGGQGFSVSVDGAAVFLNPFTADASANIAADPSGLGPGIPEPATCMLMLMGFSAVVCGWRRSR
ncbi:MAG TPA: hypothetical protein VHE81_03180 [Lacipirellulaceae bacterium]|nr:hypothetical protein [Lacipirellulaceae bacterium]